MWVCLPLHSLIGRKSSISPCDLMRLPPSLLPEVPCLIQSLKAMGEDPPGQHRSSYMSKLFGWMSNYRLSKHSESKRSEDDWLPTSDFLFTLVVVGDDGAGKSSIIGSLTGLESSSFSGICTHRIQLDSNSVQLQIWELPSSSHFESTRADLYKVAHGILVIYDLTSLESYVNLEQWLKEVSKYRKEKTCVFVVGNKNDEMDKRVIGTEAAKSFVEKSGFLYMETSAKTGAYISTTFTKVASEIKRRNAHEIAEGGLSGKRKPIRINPLPRLDNL